MSKSETDKILEKSIENMEINFPPHLPLSGAVDEIIEAWKHNQVIIIGGDTGSGKTTQLPKIAIKLGLGLKGKIGCTQPRRLAACAMAQRVAQETKTLCGSEVGYQVRFDDKTSKSTVIKFMTDGILLAETRSDRNLKDYECLIIDEAHERSLNIDFILGYIKKLIIKRPDLKIAISSATLDMEQFSKFFFNAPVISVKGRTFPVEDMYMPPEIDEELSSQVGRAVDFATELDRHGDILVFMPGEREIRDAAALLIGRKLPNTEVLTLFARLSANEQQKVFNPGNLRRIIISTNVAETSVTIPRIRFVIDSGLARVKRYNPRRRVEELQIENISQASAGQRRGRCGRIADGVCIRLYSEDDLLRSVYYTDPEIKRSALSGVILQMASLHLGKIEHFPFIDAPTSAAVRDGLKTLEDIQAITHERQITKDGWKLASIPLDPHIGKMLLTAEKLKVLSEVIVVAAFVSIQDPRERPQERQQAADDAHRKFRHADSDFMTIINLWNAIISTASRRLLRKFCKDNFLNYNRVSEWKNIVDDIKDLPNKDSKFVFNNTIDVSKISYDLLHQAILSGIPRNIGYYFKEGAYYIGCGGKHFQIFPGSGIYKRKPQPEWLLSFALVETTKLYARTNALINPAIVENVASHLCSKVYSNIAWDEKSGYVYAREKVLLGGLTINNGRKIHYGKTHPIEAREIFIRQGLAQNLVEIAGNKHWVAKHNKLLNKLYSLENKIRRPGTIVNEDAIAEYYLTILPETVNSTQSLKELIKYDKNDYCIPEEDAIQHQLSDVNIDNYPDLIEFSGEIFELEYNFNPGEADDGITLLCESEKMVLLPEWSLDYLVRGFLPEKLEIMFRALPKTVRQKCGGASNCIQAFLQSYDAKELFTEQPLETVFTDFLIEYSSQVASSFKYAPYELPEYLQMKLLEFNPKTNKECIYKEIPSSLKTGSKLGSLTVKNLGLKSDVIDNLNPFPSDGLPEKIPLPKNEDKFAWCGLSIEQDIVENGAFLNEDEAKAHHSETLVKIFKNNNSSQIKFLAKGYKLPNEIVLSWTINYPNIIDDLIDTAIIMSFEKDPWAIRTNESFSIAVEKAKGNTHNNAVYLINELTKIYNLYAKLKVLISKVRGRSNIIAAEIEEQLKHMFRISFLGCGEIVFNDYPRYLKGAMLRSERAISDPSKDINKGKELLHYIELFNIAATSTNNFNKSYSLIKFWQLLEEARLATYSPEIRLTERSPVSKLKSTWENLR